MGGTRPRDCAPGRWPGNLVVEDEDDDDDAEEDNEVPTQEGPGQPVVDGAEDPSVRVERQEQGRDPRGHAEILGRILQAPGFQLL